MKTNPLLPVLVGLLFLSAAFTAMLSLRYVLSIRELRSRQPQVALMNSRLSLAQALLNDTLEYSQRNPAIDSLLVSMNFKTNLTAATPLPKSVTK